MLPALELWNFSPNSTGLASSTVTMAGVGEASHRDGLPLVTVTPMLAPGLSWLRLSSTARALIVAAPVSLGTQLYSQFSRPRLPVAGCAARHSVPPSTETSTPPTTPAEAAVPAISTLLP